MRLMLKPVLCAIAIASVGLAPMAVQAAAYLCVEDAMTGFDWEGGKWVQKSFFTRQWLVRKLDPDDAEAFMCQEIWKSEGQPGSEVMREAGAKVFGCYSQTEVGKEASFGLPCEERFDVEGKIRLIECNAAVSYRFEPNGEYVQWVTYPAIAQGDMVPESRDSVAVSVGRCSKLSD